MSIATLLRAGGRTLGAVALTALLFAATSASSAQVTQFGAKLSGLNEVPANASTASGVVFATFNAGDNSLAVTGFFEGLESDFNFGVGAHVHEAPAGANGPIAFALTPSINADNRSGSFNAALNTFALTEDQVTTLFAEGFYVNIHSTDIASGELRGQIVETAKVQVIHNSPEPAAFFVDVYVDGTLAVDNLRFRKATPYLDVAAGSTEVVVMSSDSNEEGNVEGATTFGTFDLDLEAGVNYQAAASGVAQAVQPAYSGNPDGRDISFALQIKESAQTTSPRITRVSANAFHGAPDAPTVSLSLRDNYEGRSASITYGDVTRYYSPSARRDYIIDVSFDGEVIAAFFAPAFTLQVGGLGGAVLASGFLTPEDEATPCNTCSVQRLPRFRLMAVAPDGRAGTLKPAPLPDEDGPTVAQTGGARAEGLIEEIALLPNYPNPFAGATQLRFELPEEAEVSARVYDVLGREVLTLPQRPFAGGTTHALDLDASGLAAGTYLYRIDVQMGATTETLNGQMTVLQ
ncbi:MAG: CHRD domain-containing protein [Bacteroidota bacterium]